MTFAESQERKRADIESSIRDAVLAGTFDIRDHLTSIANIADPDEVFDDDTLGKWAVENHFELKCER